MKILVVDDSRAMRAIVKRALSGLGRVRGAIILEAADGREALASVVADEPDLVLSDWNMPEMSGLVLLQTLNEGGYTVPFGFITAESTPEMHELAKAHGARFLVTKPFTPAAIDRALARVV